MGRIEHRTVPAGSIRPARAGHSTRGRTKRPRFEAVVMRYNVVDDYGTRFAPGVFTESLSRHLPRVVWAHDWTEPLGRYVDYRDTDQSLTLVGEFDDFDAVPRARQAWAQLKSGTIDQFSVGFVRLEERPARTRDAKLEDVTDITKATLDEASLVLTGAVPGTELVGLGRSARARPHALGPLPASRTHIADRQIDAALAKVDAMRDREIDAAIRLATNRGRHRGR